MKVFIFAILIVGIVQVFAAPQQYGGQGGYIPPAYAAKPSFAPSNPGPSYVYTYPSPSPPVQCPTNLLFSCQPAVAPVPCQSVSYSAPAPAPSSKLTYG